MDQNKRREGTMTLVMKQERDITKEFSDLKKVRKTL